MRPAANVFRAPAVVLPPERWHGRDTVRLAADLLGKFLVRTRGASTEARMITEVEAYDGEQDLACHARAGRTARTATMYGAGGRWYVYLCYGVHEMLNLVTGPEGWPAAILIRGVAGASGPGRLTAALGIDRRLNGAVAAPAGGLHLEDRGVVVGPRLRRATPRVGVAFAGPVWAAKPWRFVVPPDAVPRLLRQWGPADPADGPGNGEQPPPAK